VIASDLAALAPTGGIAGLVGVLMALQYRSSNDQRKNELELRAEFSRERAILREECAKERERDRDRIDELQRTVDRLWEQMGRKSDAAP
jgi:hypothetical protein